MTAGTADLQEGAGTLKKGLDTLKDGTTQYVSGANTLADGVTQYVAGADQLAAGAKQLSPLEGIGQVSSGISQLNSSISKGEGSLKSGTQQMCIRDSSCAAVSEAADSSEVPSSRVTVTFFSS